MKNKIKMLIIMAICAVMIIGCFAGCSMDGVSLDATTDNQGQQLSFVANFYNDTSTLPWLSVEGTSFDIKPNKVKEYLYDENGSWIEKWTTSSIVSVDINGKSIETCGSTIIFADTRIEPIDFSLPTNIKIDDKGIPGISAPNDLRFSDFWTLQWWFDTKNINLDSGSKVVIIQTPSGKPIAMYSGAEVSWDIPRNLPKTTEITIDGMPLYIHRANFMIVDSDLLITE